MLVLSALAADARAMMPTLCVWANAEEPPPSLNRRQHQAVREWLGAARRWDRLSRGERQEVLEELADTVRGVHVSLCVADEGRRGPESPVEEAERFGFKIGERVKRAKRRVPYVSAWVEPRTPGRADVIGAALMVLWLLDHPKERARLRQCNDDRCRRLFWNESPTRPRRFCPGGCKNRYHVREHAKRR